MSFYVWFVAIQFFAGRCLKEMKKKKILEYEEL